MVGVKNSVRNSIGLVSVVLSTIALLTVVSITRANHDIPTLAECQEAGNKIRICHATSSEENPYTDLDIACAAAFGQAGHFNENGTTRVGHEDDFVPHGDEACPGLEPTPSPSPSPSPEVTPSPTPSPSPEVDPSPTPSPSPSPSPTPTPSVGRSSSLGTNVTCSNEFETVLDATDNGNGVKDVKVKFTYNGSVKEVKTNNGGRASVHFGRSGDGNVTAEPEGFSNQTQFVTMPKDCPPQPGTGGGEVLGATTEAPRGKVLGATTLAATGTASTTIASIGLVLGMMLVGGSYYGYRQSKAN
jgi:hypothetical protein